MYIVEQGSVEDQYLYSTNRIIFYFNFTHNLTANQSIQWNQLGSYITYWMVMQLIWCIYVFSSSQHSSYEMSFKYRHSFTIINVPRKSVVTMPVFRWQLLLSGPQWVDLRVFCTTMQGRCIWSISPSLFKTFESSLNI